MLCVRCQSDRLNEFPSEIVFHFSGRENRDKPHVFAFPKVVVCLDCGCSRFALAETELRQLREGSKSSSASQLLSPSDLPSFDTNPPHKSPLRG
jgi:hypothetical protein